MNKRTCQRAGALLMTLTMTMGLCPATLAAETTASIGYENHRAPLSLTQIGRYDASMTNADGGVMEIVDYNQKTGYAYAINGQIGMLTAIPMLELKSGTEVAALKGTNIDVAKLVTVDGFTYGDMTSVAVSPDGTQLAAAIQAKDYTATGRVALFSCNSDGSLTFQKAVETGVQPDMVTFTPDGTKILTANEGEPRLGYSTVGVEDPKGTVTIVNVASGEPITVDFSGFDWAEKRASLVNSGIVLKKDTAPSVDLEPEYIACTDTAAFVTCQEANAIAVLDLNSKEFTGVYSAGFEDHSKTLIDLGNGDDTYAPQNYNDLQGIRMPDAISLYQTNGKTYLLTANEGDSRAWPVKDTEFNGLTIVEESDVNEIKDKNSPNGKVFEKKITWFDASQYDGLMDGVDYLFGARSFTMFEVTSNGLTEVFDSESDFEAKTATYLPDYFNCSNDSLEVEDRSGKKGPEPETVIVDTVGDKTYAFVTLERIGGIMVYDITDPANVTHVNYMNSRNFINVDEDGVGADDSPEGLKFVSAENSPTENALLLAACEVGGTVAVYELTEAEPPTKPETPAASETRTYTVVKGDTLWNISARVYGSGSLWKTIYDANKGSIKNPNVIHVGQPLILPN